MGLMDRLRNELVDIIEWVDDTNNTLVWRFPRFQNEIKNGAQLIVRPGQVAVLIQEGNLADVFEPGPGGPYTLSTQNIPILTSLKSWKYGLNSPFKCEVYFVSTRQIPGLKWGTPNPIMLRDADFGPIRLRAFGSYTLRCTNPRTLLKELVGTDGVYQTDEVGELMRGLIQSEFASLLGESKVAALDLAQNYRSMGETLRKRVLEKIDDEYGLDLTQLNISNISLPEEVEKVLDQRSSMGILGDMGKFQQMQMGNAMMAAAQNPAGPGPGVGIGLGMAMAGQMMNPMMNPGFQQQQMQMQPQMQQPPPMMPPPLPGMPPPLPQMWHVNMNGQNMGPVDVNWIMQALSRGQVKADNLVWSQGMASWMPLGQVPTFAAMMQASMPPPLPR